MAQCAAKYFTFKAKELMNIFDKIFSKLYRYDENLKSYGNF